MEGVSTSKLPQIRHSFDSELQQSKTSFNLDGYSRSQTQIGKLGNYVIDTPCDEGLQRREQLWNYQHSKRGALIKPKGNGDVPSFRYTQQDTNESDKDKRTHENKAGSEKKIVARLRLRTTKVNPKSSTVYYSELDVSDRSKSSPPHFSVPKLENKPSIVSKTPDKDTSGAPSVSQLDKYIKQNLSYSTEKLPDLTSALSKLGYMRFTRNVVHYGGGFFGRHGDLSRSWTTLSNAEASKISGAVFPHVLDNKSYGSFRNLDFIRGNVSDVQSVPKTNSEKRDELLSCLKKTPLKTDKTKLKMLLQNELTKKIAAKQRKTTGVDIEISKLLKTRKERKELNNKNISVRDSKLDLNNNDTSECSEAKQIISDIVKPLSNDTLKISSNGTIRPSRNFDRLKTCENIALKQPTKTLHAGGKKVERIDESKSIRLAREKSDISIDIPVSKFGPSTHERNSLNAEQSQVSNVYHWNKKSYISENDKHWIKKTLEDSRVIDQSIYGGFARTRPVHLPKIMDSKRSNETRHD